MLAIPRASKASDCLLRGLIADSRLAGLGKLDELLLSGVGGGNWMSCFSQACMVLRIISQHVHRWCSKGRFDRGSCRNSEKAWAWRRGIQFQDATQCKGFGLRLLGSTFVIASLNTDTVVKTSFFLNWYMHVYATVFTRHKFNVIHPYFTG